MKKILFSLITTLLGLVAVNGQVTMSYDATVSSGTYTALTGATVVPLGATGTDLNAVVYDGSGTANTSQVTAAGFPIGFDFKFDNQVMNQFFIGAHGYLVLGKDMVTTTATTNFSTLFSDSEYDVLGVVYRSIVYGLPETEISYKTEGAAPNRKTIVQYKNLGLAVNSWDGLVVRDTVQIQISLCESGAIQFVLNGFQPDNAISLDYNDAFKIGIRGTGDDRLMKISSFSGDEFSTNDNFIRWTKTSYPADGLTYTFTPPADCAIPATQPTDLQLTSTSLAVNGTFTPTTDADHYLVLVSRNTSLAKLPENGTTYANGDSIGDARVIAYTTKTSFASGDILDGAHTYYIYVMGVNSFCFYGPKYNVTSPLTGNVATLAAAPKNMKIVDYDLTQMTFDITANDNNDQVIVLLTDQSGENYGNITTEGVFGEPTGNENVGDEVAGGGTVIYKGLANNPIVANALTANKVYHAKAWSLDVNGIPSSTAVTVNGVTAAEEPWNVDFTQMAPFSAPIGWLNNNDESSAYEWRIEKEGVLSNRISSKDAINGQKTWIESPYIYLGEGTNRLVFNLLMTEYANWSNKPYVLNPKDSIVIQVTTDGINYDTIKTITKADGLKFQNTNDYVTFYAKFTNSAGQKARLRLLLHLYGGPTTKISKFKVENVGHCDYPIDVQTVEDLLVGDEAGIVWTPQGEEDAWEIRYKKNDAEEWSNPMVVRSYPYVIKGLEGLTMYNVQVRARCSSSEQSEWSESCTFKSGLKVPFVESFADEPSAPLGWLSKKGDLGSPSVLTDGGGWTFQTSWHGSSRVEYNADDVTANDWYITPQFNLGDGSYNCNVMFSLGVNSDAQATDYKLYLMVARDGENFYQEDSVKVLHPEDFPEIYSTQSYTTSLKGYTGKVRLGFLIVATDGYAPQLELDTVSVQYSCVNDIENFTVVDTTETTAKVTWQSNASEWYVFHRQKGETETVYQTVTTPELTMTGLSPHTTYEVGIRKACEVGDTAKVMIFEVVIPGETCPEPTNVQAKAKDYTTTITWEGEANGYNVRYRVQNNEIWIKEVVTDTFVVLDNLMPETIYEYQIQAMCSQLEADTSAYTPLATFVTTPISCAVPSNIAITPTYNAATITWESEAERFDLQYRPTTATKWVSQIIVGNMATITDLASETDYKLRIRAICAVEDSSRWSASIDFTTLAEPECVTPTNLQVSDITANSAILSWNADESNLTWNLRYRESNASAWTEKTGLPSTTYSLTELQSNTAYVWRVQAVCQTNQSNWAAQNRFTTTILDGISDTGIEELDIFVKNKMLNVVNPESGIIRNIQLYDTNGRLIATYEVNSRENVFILLNQTGEMIIKVNGQKQSKVAHFLVK